jgi:hypothetical protein
MTLGKNKRIYIKFKGQKIQICRCQQKKASEESEEPTFRGES